MGGKIKPEEKTNILLVDDKPSNLMLLEAILESPDYRLVKAASGMEALRHLLKDEFAVILLDVMMPEMDGFETAKRIRQRDQSKDVPILFITAMDPDEEAMFKAASVGAVDYLFKPFDSDILKTKVSLLVDLHKKNRLLWRE